MRQVYREEISEPQPKPEMNIEIGENLRLVTSIGLVAATICAISMYGCSEFEQTQRKAIESGLVQSQHPGSQKTIWTLPTIEK